MFGVVGSQSLLIFALGLFGALAVMPYAFAMNKERISQAPLPRPVMLAISILQNAVLIAIAAFVGLWAAGRTGLGAPLIFSALSGEPLLAEVARYLPVTLLLSVGTWVSMLALEHFVLAPHVPQVLRQSDIKIQLWKRVLASFYGGLTEEILMRLFLMNLLAWLLSLLWSTSDGTPLVGAIWAANVLAALLFGLGHLPATAALTKLTPWVIARAVVLNGIAGIVFGVLFWQYGLLAAMIAHFTMDILLHVITPMLAPASMDHSDPAGPLAETH
ncbi:MAG: CPBP family intramembrane metalloprotease [Anaerolineales bacterium]